MATQMENGAIEYFVQRCMYACKEWGLDLLECMEKGFDTAIANGADEKSADKMVAHAAVLLYPAPIEAR